ncbi:MAG: peptidoglycan D,D-transpeptidase FtsI family protein [Candidatus Gracilibacteria bacterium]
MRTYYKGGKKATDRIFIIGVFIGIFALIILIRLFYLQVNNYKYYRALAENQQVTTTVEPATRGKIFIKADNSGEYRPVATNVPLDLLYVDPNPYNSKELDNYIDQQFVALNVAPILYSHFCELHVYELAKGKTCVEIISDFTGKPTTKLLENATTAATAVKKKETKSIELEKTKEDLIKDIAEYMSSKLQEKEVNFVPLFYSKDQPALQKIIDDYKLPGIYVGEGLIYGQPMEVLRRDGGDIMPQYEALAKAINVPMDKLGTLLSRRLSRYVKIVDRIHPELTAKIREFNIKEQKCPIFYARPERQKDLTDPSDPICQHVKANTKGKPVRNFYGIGIKTENWRYYPEENLASPVIGFVNFEKTGVYGIEEEFDNQLRGTDGEFKLKSDPMGRFIATDLKADELKPKENGIDIYLTLDRVLQKKVEELLEKKVQDTKANSGQVIVIDPFTGNIVAMAQHPNFNPNTYSDVYATEPISYDPGKGIPMFYKDDKGQMILVDEYGKSTIPAGAERAAYTNKFGPGAYFDKPVQGTYEPGSIFKPIVMAAAIDAGEVTPQTRYMDKGELKVDEFTIHNVSEKCLGYQNMINVLNYSCNIGMSFIAKQLGKALIYKYITEFGFGSRTDIELPNESKGIVTHFDTWSDAKLFNAAFGQGLTVTPLQMAQAYSALANGGILISPRIIDKIVHPSGKEEKRKVQYIKRVISKETADTVAAMLTSVVENGGSKVVKTDGYFVAGKTGTAQIAGRGGYEPDEVGNTNGSFSGFFPADKPRYVIIVVIERPRSSKWADSTAAPLFKEITDFMIDYYHIPPER